MMARRVQWARVWDAVKTDKCRARKRVEMRGALAEEVRRPEQAVAAGRDSRGGSSVSRS